MDRRLTSQDPDQAETNRRPIASRQWRVSRQLAGWLARGGVSPNAISVAGMLSAVVAGAALASTGQVDFAARWLWLIAALGMQLRLIANMLDGMVALESNRTSPLGEFCNEVPDRVSDVVIFVGAGFAAGGDVLSGCLAAVAAVLTAYARVFGASLGLGHDFRGPMAKQHRMAVMTVACVALFIAPDLGRWTYGGDGRMSAIAAATQLVAVGALITFVRRLTAIIRRVRGQSHA